MMKRCLDVSVAALLLMMLSPVFVLLAVLIRVCLGAPIFFCQRRPGKQGVPFNMIKFRTMLNEQGTQGPSLTDAQRLTRLGRCLRATSLDELPGLWSVLKGEMSLVGPRPLLMEYLPLYTAEQNKRHQVRPGITGWAQVNGRNAISWEEKFRLDVWYVEHASFWLDIKILGMTLKKVLLKENIHAEGEATMFKFTGSDASESLSSGGHHVQSK